MVAELLQPRDHCLEVDAEGASKTHQDVARCFRPVAKTGRSVPDQRPVLLHMHDHAGKRLGVPHSQARSSDRDPIIAGGGAGQKHVQERDEGGKVVELD